MSIGILLLNSKRLAARLKPMQELLNYFESESIQKSIVLDWHRNGAITGDEASLLITAHMLETA